jgi:hypothetical protein
MQAENLSSSDNQSSLPSWGSSFSGKGSSFGDQIRQRDQMATVMLMAIKAGNINTAKRALSALLHIEPSLQLNQLLIKIGDALMEGHVLIAQEFAAHFSIEAIDSLAH